MRLGSQSKFLIRYKLYRDLHTSHYEPSGEQTVGECRKSPREVFYFGKGRVSTYRQRYMDTHATTNKAKITALERRRDWQVVV